MTMPRVGTLGAGAVALLLLWSAAWLLVLGAPAMAAPTGYGVQTPSSGERISRADPIRVTAFVDLPPGEEVDSVEARLVKEGAVLGGVQHLEFLDSQSLSPTVTRTRWSLRLDPMNAQWVGGGALANGPYAIQVRTTTVWNGVPQDATEWAGHSFILDLDPPPTVIEIGRTDGQLRGVELVWKPVALPDFVRYLIQRADGEDGEWADLGQVSDPARDRYVDRVPEHGHYRYRIRVFRTAAAGGERGSDWSGAAAVNVVPPPPEPEPEPGGEPGEPGEQQAPLQPPVVRNPAPRTAPRPAPPTQPDVYSETLDYSGVELPEFSTPESEATEPGAAEPQAAGSYLEVEGGNFDLRTALAPIAAGLVLTVGAWHLRRFIKA